MAKFLTGLRQSYKEEIVAHDIEDFTSRKWENAFFKKKTNNLISYATL